MQAIHPPDTFDFACSPEVPCFNHCCGDLNQFLTPYDILRLKHRLNLPSDRFLEAYTDCHTGPGTGLPVVTLKTAGPADRTCVFLTPAGCAVYADRPSSCRMYPLGRVVSRCRTSGKTTERFFLLREPHCRGFDRGQADTIAGWMAAQGLGPYNAVNDLLLDIVSLKNRLHPGPLDAPLRRLFYTVCYDIDPFRQQIDPHRPHPPDNPSVQPKGNALHNDIELLKLGLRRLAQAMKEKSS